MDIRAGEEVTISYLPPMKGNITRRRTIRSVSQSETMCDKNTLIAEICGILSVRVPGVRT